MRRLIGATVERRDQRPADRLRPEQRHLHRQRLAAAAQRRRGRAAGGRVQGHPHARPPHAGARARAGSRPAAPAPTPAPGTGLRPSTTLGGEAAQVIETAGINGSRAGAPGSRLEARGLKKSYGSRTVVKDVSLDVQKGEVVGLLGPNGAGKTTSFYMIVGLVRADAGEITHRRRADRPHADPPPRAHGPELPAAGGVDLPQAHGRGQRARGARTAARARRARPPGAAVEGSASRSA